MGAIRAGIVLAGFAGLTVPLLPVQELLLRLAPARARTFPNWYHRQVCKVLGIRLHIEGDVTATGPVLLVSNHTSWLDIPVLSAMAPLSFVAKREVGGWPGVSLLARLQRTVYVDRQRRSSLEGTTSEIRTRLTGKEALVLFAEGTSSDGNRVLPFRSSLFAAAIPSSKKNGKSVAQSQPARADLLSSNIQIQTVTLAYTRLHGIPLGRADRPGVGWYGDMEMLSHAWTALKAGPLDVAIKIGPPVPVSDFKDRKALALHTEDEVRKNHASILRRRDKGEEFDVAPPASDLRKSPVFSSTPVKSQGGMR